jgi:AcrR family transcriptional regulator
MRRPARRRSSTRTEPAPIVPPRRRFAQARSRATCEALLVAARQVFAERGFDEAQTPEIAERAGVAVGTFYRYFKDKRAAFVEMIAHHLARVHAEVSEQLEPVRSRQSDTRAVVDHALSVLARHMREYPGLQRVYLEMSLRDEEVARLRARFEALGERTIADLLAEVAPREVVPDPAAAAHVLVVAVVEVTLSRAGLRGPRVEGAGALDDAAVGHALRELVHRFVFPSPGSL